MAEALCPSCDGIIGEWQRDGRLFVNYHHRRFIVERGEVECTRYVRKGVRGDGTVLMGACGTFTPVTVEVRERIAV